MFTVALIGGDGAGKTTIAETVIRSSGLPMKYLYMGLSTRSSNFALPTSRLVLFLKQRAYKKSARHQDNLDPERMPAGALEYAEVSHGWIWNTGRFLNRLAEAWYRQLISFKYRLQGYIVVYDRHFFFDSSPDVVDAQDRQQPLDRLYFWLMSHCYPRPDLAIFLDAPSEMLYARKHEANPDYLDRQRLAFLKQGEKLKHFVRVDASQPLDTVLQEVTDYIRDFYADRYPQKSTAGGEETSANK